MLSPITAFTSLVVQFGQRLSQWTACAHRDVTYFTPRLDQSAQAAFLLTTIRLPLAGAFAFWVTSGNPVAAAATMMLAVLLDIVDGVVFARSEHSGNAELARSRRLLDAVCDRVLIATAIASSYFADALSPALAILLAGRELILMVVVTIPFFVRAAVLRPNFPSRLGTTLGGLAGCLAINDLAVSFVIPAYLTATIFGLYLYIRRPACL